MTPSIQKIKIGISGARETGHCGLDALDQAKVLGRHIAESGALLSVDIANGFPLWVTLGARECGGMVVGFSPAVCEREHCEVYRLPVEHFDVVVYSGFGQGGSRLLATRSSDAMIFGCGSLEAAADFADAFQEGKVIGILESMNETSNPLKDLVEKYTKKGHHIIVDSDPHRLIDQIMHHAKKERVAYYHL